MAGHALVHTFELSIPILIPLWLAQFDTTAAVIGVVVGIGYALFGIGALPAGLLTDAVGSRRIIAVCMLGMGTSFLVLSVAPTVWTIALALLCWGIAASLYHPAGLTLISKGVQERGRGFAYHGMAGNLGIALGPAITVLLLIVFDWRTTVAILTIPALAAGVLALRLDLDETAAVKVTSDGGVDRELRSLEEIASDTRTLFASAFAVIFVMVIFSGLYYRGFLTFLPEIVAAFPRFDPIEIGGEIVEPANYFFVGLLLIGVLGQYAGGLLTDRIRTEVGLAMAFLVLIVTTLLFIPASQMHIATFLLVAGLLGFFMFMAQPLYQATVAIYTPPTARGLSYGFMYLGVFGIGAVGGMLAGILLTFASAAALFLLLAALVAGAATLAVFLILRDV